MNMIIHNFNMKNDDMNNDISASLSLSLSVLVVSRILSFLSCGCSSLSQFYSIYLYSSLFIKIYVMM